LKKFEDVEDVEIVEVKWRNGWRNCVLNGRYIDLDDLQGNILSDDKYDSYGKKSEFDLEEWFYDEYGQTIEAILPGGIKKEMQTFEKVADFNSFKEKLKQTPSEIFESSEDYDMAVKRRYMDDFRKYISMVDVCLAEMKSALKNANDNDLIVSYRESCDTKTWLAISVDHTSWDDGDVTNYAVGVFFSWENWKIDWSDNTVESRE
jgi:hypothetical protein